MSSLDPLALVPVITNAGLAACLRAQGDGVTLQVAQVAVGRGIASGSSWAGYAPARTQTALVREDARVPILSGSILDGSGFRTLCRFDPTTDGSEIPVREVGWYLSTGELLCVWSEVAPYPLTYRTPRASVDLAFDLYLAQIPLSVLTLSVAEPDVPDTTGVLAELLSCTSRTLIADLAAERLRAGFAS